MENAIVEPLPLSSAPSEDTDSLIPVLATEHLISQQLADLGRSRFDGSEIRPELLPPASRFTKISMDSQLGGH